MSGVLFLFTYINFYTFSKNKLVKSIHRKKENCLGTENSRFKFNSVLSSN